MVYGLAWGIARPVPAFVCSGENPGRAANAVCESLRSRRSTRRSPPRSWRVWVPPAALRNLEGGAAAAVLLARRRRRRLV
jgi:hypothetical protein